MSSAVYRMSPTVDYLPCPLTRATVARYFSPEGSLTEEGLCYIQTTYQGTAILDRKHANLIVGVSLRGRKTWHSFGKRKSIVSSMFIISTFPSHYNYAASQRICLVCSSGHPEAGYHRIDRFTRHDVVLSHRERIAEMLGITEAQIPRPRRYPCDSPNCNKT